MALPNPIQSYFVPVREQDLVREGNAEGTFETINFRADESDIRSLISISVAAEGTVVFYDHWEDGFELDPTNPQQSTTLIWGDGDTGNGTAPGTINDLFEGGESFVVKSTVPVDRDTSDIFFDGGDLVSASFPIAVTRAAFPTETGSVLAGATEALDTDSQGDAFVIPFGTDTGGETDPFDVTEAHVMASQANTPVFLNGNQVDTIVSPGGTFLVKGVEEGDSITTYDPDNASSGKGVQVTLVTGDEGSRYETRSYSLLARDDWSNDYYTPVFTGENGAPIDQSSDFGPTRIWLFNPDDSALDVTVEFAGGATSTVAVPAGGSAISPIVPNGSGARFYSEDERDFYAVTQTDASGFGQFNDWGHPLVPAEQLTSQAIIGLGFGNTDQLDGGNSGDNRSLVWVAATQDDTTINIDFDGDGTVDDDTHTLDALESIKVVDDDDDYETPSDDNDMSGAIIFATDADGNPVDIAVAYGQDPETEADESNSLDFGTVVPPLPEFEASKNVTLKDDADGNGQFSPGDTVTYTINVLNFGRVDLPQGSYVIDDEGVPVFDAVTEGDGNGPLEYVLGSTAVDFDTANPGTTPITDSGSGTPFPLDGAGYTSGAMLEAGENHLITFDATIKAFDDLPAGIDTFTNRGALETTTKGLVDTFEATAPLAFDSGVDIEKSTNGVDADTPAEGPEIAQGSDITWIYEVTNTGETHLANVDVSDDQGVNVVFASGDTDNDNVLDPNETWVFTGSGTADLGDYRNEGTVEAHAVFADGSTAVPGNAGGGTVSDSDLSHHTGVPSGAVKGRVFEDAEADGVEDMEPGSGIADAHVDLLDASGNVVVTTTTDADGAYVFQDVPVGDYSVRFTQPSDYDGVSPQDVGDDATDSDGDVVSLETEPFSVGAGETVTDMDQGFYATGEIGDTVFDDADGDGIQDAGEAGVEGVGVELRDGNGTPVGTATTNADGTYLFPDLVPGTYSVAFDAPGNTLFTTPNVGSDDTVDSDAAADGTTDPITITSGEVKRDVDAGLVTPAVTFDKQADKASVSSAGETITYTYKATNTGTAPLTSVEVTDDALTPDDTSDDFSPSLTQDGNGDAVLDVGETWVFEASETVSQGQIDAGDALTNVATLTTAETDPETDDATVTIDLASALAFTKDVVGVSGSSTNAVTAAGQVITYDLVATNEGNVTLENVTITDPLTGADSAVGTLPPGESTTVTAEYTVTQADIDANGVDAEGNPDGDGDIDNIATAKSDQTGEITADAAVIINRNADVALVKSADIAEVDAAGQTVTYTYTVENTGNVSLTDVALSDAGYTDDPNDDLDPQLEEGDTDGDGILDVGETWIFEASETVSQSQIDAGDALTNVATVETAETDPVTAEETVTVAQAPGIALDKTADRDVVTATGQTVTYKYTVENTGNVSLNDVTIVDDAGTPGNPADDVTLGDNGPDSGDTDGDGALDPDEEWIFTWDANLGNTEGAAELTNTAVVTTEEGAEDSDTATVAIEPEAERCTDVADHFDRPDGPVGATLVYAPAAPYRNGSDADDFAWGDDRGNTISTNGGENVVVANGGNDIVNGGNAADEIYGDAGNDILNGNGGDDRLSGGAGNDKLYGAHGDDKIMAGDGDDLVEGGAGDDRIHGGAGNDTIQGEGGDDCIAGGADDGRIDGSIAQGLTVTMGDRLFGNGGADLFEYEAGDGVDFMFDFKAEDGDTLKLFGLDEDDATAVTANTPYGPAAGLAFDTDGDGRFDGGVFFQQIRHTAEVDDLVQDNTIEFV